MSKELGSKKKFGSSGKGKKKKKRDRRVCFCDFTRRCRHYDDDSITKLTGVKQRE